MRDSAGPTENLLRVALGGDDLGCLADVLDKASLRGRQFVKRHVVLPNQIAISIALPRPAFVFGKRVPDVFSFQFSDQADNMLIQFRLCDGQ
jgi:hypothetical protein